MISYSYKMVVRIYGTGGCLHFLCIFVFVSEHVHVVAARYCISVIRKISDILLFCWSVILCLILSISANFCIVGKVLAYF